MTEVTTTVQMDEQGRLYIPKAARRALGVEGTSATLEIDIEVLGDD